MRTPRLALPLLVLPLLALACKPEAPPPPPPAPMPTEGEVTFQSAPPGARVELDGQAQPGATPFTLKLPAGKDHTARFLLDGYEPASATFTVQLSPYTAQVALKPAVPVEVSSEPPGAHIEIDGRPMLPATPGKVWLTSGEHVLTARLEGYAATHLKLRDGERAPVNLKLTHEAYLHLTSVPDGAAVFLDGVDLGVVTPQEKLAVPAGVAHTVLLRSQKLATGSLRIKALKPGEVHKLNATLSNQDMDALTKQIRKVKEELAHWQSVQRKYQRADDKFMINDAKKAKVDAEHLQEADAHVDELSNQLADLNDQVEAMR